MGIDLKKNQFVIQAFNTNRTYFEMMRERHQQHDGLAVEPEVKKIIEDHCSTSGHRILEAGCGEGSIIYCFAHRYDEVEFVGVDVGKIGIEMAQQLQLPNLKFLVADLKQLPFNDESFDFVFSQSVLEHVVNWELALKEICRILRKGGRLLIRVGNGGVEGKRLGTAFIDYLFKRNHVLSLNPSFKLPTGDRQAHRENFDVQEIPSDVLIQELKANGYYIDFFSTRTHLLRKRRVNWKALLFWPISVCNFWPFNHLGPTSIVLVRK